MADEGLEQGRRAAAILKEMAARCQGIDLIKTRELQLQVGFFIQVPYKTIGKEVLLSL